MEARSFGKSAWKLLLEDGKITILKVRVSGSDFGISNQSTRGRPSRS